MKNKWENSSWGKKLIVQKRRASLNDFDRFKVMLAKIKVILRSTLSNSTFIEGFVHTPSNTLIGI